MSQAGKTQIYSYTMSFWLLFLIRLALVFDCTLFLHESLWEQHQIGDVWTALAAFSGATAAVMVFFGLVGIGLSLLTRITKSESPEFPQAVEIDGSLMRLYDGKKRPYADLELSNVWQVEDPSFKHMQLVAATKIVLSYAIGPPARQKNYILLLPGLGGYHELMRRLRSLPQVRSILPKPPEVFARKADSGDELLLVVLGLPVSAAVLVLTAISITRPQFFWGAGAALEYKWLTIVAAAAAAAWLTQALLRMPTKITRCPWGFELTRCWLSSQKVKPEDVLAVEFERSRLGGPERLVVRLRSGSFRLSPGEFDHYFDLVDYLLSLQRC